MQEENKTIAAIRKNYEILGNVRVTFRFESMHVLNGQKIQMFFPSDDELLRVKVSLEAKLKKQFYFFLNHSFMPSLQSKVGDLAKAYGRMENNELQICFIVCEKNDRYG